MTETQNEEQVVLPGARLREMLEERGWSQVDLATILGGDPKAPNEIIGGRRSITPRTAGRLAAALGTTAKYWLDLESAYQLAQVDHDQVEISKRAKIFEKAPVREMVKRGWIEETKDPAQLEARVLRFFGQRSWAETPDFVPSTARKGTDYATVTPAQRAWLCRARQLAGAMHAQNFTEKRFGDALAQLRLNLQSPEEIRQVPRILADGGVRLVVVQHLDGTKIDGWCFWMNAKSPVVALSMRYGRIDNFWFTLLHELGHIAARDGLGDSGCAIDVDLNGKSSSDAQRPEAEKKADDFARTFLIEPEKLQDFIARVGPIYRPARILGFAKLHHVHPGIVIGQLQHLGEISYGYGRKMLVDVRKYLLQSVLADGWGLPPLVTTA